MLEISFCGFVVETKWKKISKIQIDTGGLFLNNIIWFDASEHVDCFIVFMWSLKKCLREKRNGEETAPFKMFQRSVR